MGRICHWLAANHSKALVLGSMAELEFAAGDPKKALYLANEALELAFLVVEMLRRTAA